MALRTETKNLNSFRFMEQAIHHEVERQMDILEDGGEIVQETRLYNGDRDESCPCAPRKKPTTTVTSLPGPSASGAR